MKRLILVLLVLGGLAAAQNAAQTKILIPAGTPEDQALQAISNESDAQKKIGMLEEFVQKFAGNNAAVAYGNWQLSQQYAGSDPAKALAYGDKALAAMPEVVDILVSQADAAQQLKAYDKVVDYAARGAAVYHSLAKQPKPQGMSDQDFASQLGEQQKALRQNYEYLEVAGYNAIATEPNAKQRMQEIERYMPAFAGSKFTQQLATLAIVTLQETKDSAALSAFGDKVLAQSPNDIRLLTVLANAYVSDQSGAYLGKAGTYARKAIELQKSASAEDTKSLAGLAHSVLGQVLLRENKFQPASLELKTAASMLKGSGQDEAAAWYFLGYSYVKMERAADAIQALNAASAIDSPYKPLAQDLVAKIRAVRGRR